MKPLLFCLALTVASTCTSPRSRAQAAPLAAAGSAKEDVKAGTFAGLEWKSVGEGSAWNFSPERVRATLPDAGDARLRSDAALQSEAALSLPTGDWTLDAWLILRTNFSPPGVLLALGDAASAKGELEIELHGDGLAVARWRVTPEPNGTNIYRSLEEPTSAGLAEGGKHVGNTPVRWVRVVHSRAQNRIQVFINGQALSPREQHPQLPPLDFKALKGPLRFSVTEIIHAPSTLVDLARLEIRPVASEPTLSLPGLAFVVGRGQVKQRRRASRRACGLGSWRCSRRRGRPSAARPRLWRR